MQNENCLLVEMKDIDKSFPGVQALKGCRFDLRSGEIHALVGENGAGKSTMMKILAGIYPMDSGCIKINDKVVRIHNPRSAIENGIAMISQELQLMPHLTVAQNIYIGREPKKGFVFVDQEETNRKAELIIDRLNLKIHSNTLVGSLSIAGQYMVEIAKAISYQSSVLIMDEPTAALSDVETKDLFRLIRDIKEQGISTVYISHRMEELKEISDRITVMRDGTYIGTKDTKDTTIDEIISMMVGRTIYESAPELPEIPSTEIVLEVKNLNRGRYIKNVNFQLKKGEILGMAGLVGAGRTEVARAIYGADKIDSGEIYVKGKHVQITHPCDAVKLGIGYLSEDRKRYGLALGRDIESNILLASYKKFNKFRFFVDQIKSRQVAENKSKALNIVTPSLQQFAKNLSGGNQQKVVIAKWLTRDSDILIFDEPTRGIDVGAKSEIYKLLNKLVQEGKSIIMISSELPEIIRMSHRVLVMCEGEIKGELIAGEATQESIMRYATMRVISDT